MARLIQHLQNTDAPSSDYPYGRVRDNSGSGNGTPANEKGLGDMHQFFAKLMAEAGVTANGLPDNDYSGFQLFEALLKKFISNDGNLGIKTKIVEIGAWNMDSTTTVNIAHGLTLSSIIIPPQGLIRNDADTLRFVFPGLNISLGANDIDLTIDVIGPSLIQLSRKAGGIFDNTSYDQTGYNRGWITIYYV